MDKQEKRRFNKNRSAAPDKRQDQRGQRHLKQRVKSAKGRKLSSTLWLERQLNDPYVAAAKDAGYKSRAAFKLLEIDDKYKILAQGMKIVDLGAAPGGWSQVAVERIGANEHQGKAAASILAVDILEMEPVAGAQIMQLDFLSENAPEIVKEAIGGQADVVMSDMAAPTTGHQSTDHMRIIALCETAYHFATDVLKPGGTFLAKVFQGGTEGELLAQMKRDFATVHHIKPKSSRADSPEMYVLALKFKK